MANKKQLKIKQNKEEKWLILTAFFSLTMVGIAFSVLCLGNSYSPFIQGNYTLWVFISVALFCVLCGAGVFVTLYHKEAAVKMLFSVYFFTLFCLALIFIFQKTGFFDLVKSSEGLQQYLEKTGVWMPILYMLLQYLQVIILPIPGIVSTMAGVTLFGPFKTLIYSLIGILLGSITAFFIGRKLGNKAVEWIVGVETLKKWQKKLKGKDNLALTLMFLFPLFPDDILCFLAGLSSMSSRYFITMVTLTRSIGIAGTCYSFNFIPWNRWWGLAIWAVLLMGIILTFIFAYKNMDKVQGFLRKFQKKK